MVCLQPLIELQIYYQSSAWLENMKVTLDCWHFFIIYIRDES